MTPQRTFYTDKRPKIQEGFCKLFCDKYKISTETIAECLEVYRKKIESNPHQPFSRAFVLDIASAKFKDFLDVVTEKTGIKFGDFNKDKRRRKKEMGYDEWFQQSQMDGTFAYNGVTEDF